MSIHKIPPSYDKHIFNIVKDYGNSKFKNINNRIRINKTWWPSIYRKSQFKPPLVKADLTGLQHKNDKLPKDFSSGLSLTINSSFPFRSNGSKLPPSTNDPFFPSPASDKTRPPSFLRHLIWGERAPFSQTTDHAFRHVSETLRSQSVYINHHAPDGFPTGAHQSHYHDKSRTPTLKLLPLYNISCSIFSLKLEDILVTFNSKILIHGWSYCSFLYSQVFVSVFLNLRSYVQQAFMLRGTDRETFFFVP